MAEHFVFIASGGRTGTTFLGDMLSEAISDSHSEHEPDVFLGLDRKTFRRLRMFGPWQMVFGRVLGRTGVRIVGTRFLTGRMLHEQMVKALRSQRRRYHRAVSESLLIESYASWWMVASHIPEIFPHSKTVGVVRDPRSWIPSWLSHQTGRDTGHWTYRLPPGPYDAKTARDPVWGPRWDDLGPVGRLAWQWNMINGKLAEAEDLGLARNYRFEDLFDESTGKLEELIRFAATFPDREYAIDIPAGIHSDKRNSSRATGAEWEQWTAEERQLVNEICGPLMDRYGYERL